jgi:UDP-glucose 6-dehydrogenase
MSHRTGPRRGPTHCNRSNTAKLRAQTGCANIIFGPKFLRESRALYDNPHPSRIVVGQD